MFEPADGSQFLTCGGGGAGQWVGGAGEGGILNISGANSKGAIVTTYLAVNGNAGNSSHLWGQVPGGPSIYGGHGAGGSTTGTPGAGYLRITYVGSRI